MIVSYKKVLVRRNRWSSVRGYREHRGSYAEIEILLFRAATHRSDIERKHAVVVARQVVLRAGCIGLQDSQQPISGIGSIELHERDRRARDPDGLVADIPDR